MTQKKISATTTSTPASGTRFKDSGIVWLGNIPRHWEVVSLRFCFDEFDKRCGDGCYPLLSVTQDRGIILQSDMGIKKDISNDDKTKYKVVPLSTIAYNKMRMWQGAVGLNTICDGIVSPAYTIITPKNNSLPKFFFYFFKSPSMIEEFGRFSYGLCSDMNTLRYEDFQKIPVPLPPLEEQEEIAKYLDNKCQKIKKFIEEKESLITLLKEMKQATINEAVTKGLDKEAKLKDSGTTNLGNIPRHWEVVRLSRIASFINGYAFESLNFDLSHPVPVIRIGDIQNETIVYDACLRTFENDRLKNFLIKNGDIVIALSGATTGKIGICDCDTTAYINQRVAIIRSKSKIIKYFLLSHFFSDYILFTCNGSAQPNISTKDIGNLKIPLPPLEEQERIASFLDDKCKKIDRLIELSSKQIKLIKEYKTSLINETVSGRKPPKSL